MISQGDQEVNERAKEVLIYLQVSVNEANNPSDNFQPCSFSMSPLSEIYYPCFSTTSSHQ